MRDDCDVTLVDFRFPRPLHGCAQTVAHVTLRAAEGAGGVGGNMEPEVEGVTAFLQRCAVVSCK